MGNCGYRYWRILILKILVKKMFIKKIILSLILFSSIITKINCQDGTLDTTFGPNQNGTVITPPADFSGATFEAFINSIALQSNGKIIAGGATNANSLSFALARYNTNGFLDNSFGTAGTTTLSIGTASLINSLAIQSDDKIVAGGRATITGISQFALARFTSNGFPDSSFGTGGVVTLPISGASFSAINSIAIQSDGKIVAGGRAIIGGVQQFALARFTSNGSLDGSFGTGGVVTLLIGTFSNILSIAIQPDGKIVAGGFATIAGVQQFVVSRFNSDGSLDTSFGTGGSVTVPISSSSFIDSIAIQPNGKIVAGGISIESGIHTFAFARFNTNGSLDNSFGTNGITIIPASLGSQISSGVSIALQSDGKIVAVGSGNPNGILTFVFTRLQTNGTIDTTFGSNGIVDVLPLTLFGANPLDAFSSQVLIQQNGKILAGGFFDDPSLEYFALVRLNVTLGCLTNLTQAIIEKYGI